MKSNEDFTCVITNLIVLKSKDGSGPKYGKTKKGNDYVTFSAGQKVYDPDMPNGYHYNNFLFSGLGDIARKARDMNLAAGNLIKVTATMDFGLNILERQECFVPKEDARYGESRFCNGLYFSLTSLSFMNSFQQNETRTPEGENKSLMPEKEKKAEPKLPEKANKDMLRKEYPEVKTINLDEFDIFRAGNRK